MKPSDKRLPALDTLRACAILGVIVCHLLPDDAHSDRPRHLPALPGFIDDWIHFGATGVDLFFVLSGFLITSIIIREMDRHPALDVRLFLWRRWMRTFPAYYATVAIIALSDVLARMILKLDPINEGNFFPTYIFFGQNYLTEMKRFSWSWSLCIEEHFYVTLPFLVLVLRRLFPLLTWTHLLRFIAVAALVLSVGSRVWIWQSNPDYNWILDMYFRTHTHLDGLAVGVFVATLPRPRRTWAAVLMAAVALGTLLVMAHYRGVNREAASPLHWFQVFSFAPISIAYGLLAHISAGGNAWARLPIPGLRFIADISYSLYLTHYIVIRFFERALLPRVSADYAPLMTLAMLALVFAAGTAMRYAVEIPFLKLRDRFEPRRLARPVPAAPVPLGK
jgi:peptidoglycan/LPS O-acetylase OafA/YrhL